MAGYLLLKLNKGKNSYGFLGIRNNELYTDYNINDGAKFYSFKDAKPYIDRLVKAGFRVQLYGTGDFSKDRRIFENKGNKLMEEKNLKKIFDDAFSGGTIPAIETANGVMYLEPKGDKIIIGGATNAGVIPQYEFDYDFDQSFDWNIQGMIGQVLEKEGYPEDEYNENYKGRKSMKKSVNEKRVVESLDKYSKLLKDRAIENGWLNLSKKEIDKKIKELQKKGWYDNYSLDMGLLYHLKDVGNNFSESKINEGNYDTDDAWLDFCTNVKRYSTGEEVSIEDAIEAELDDLVYTSDIINVWKDMPGNLGSRINEITDLMRQDIQEGAYDDIDFISNLDESKKSVNEISDELANKVTSARRKELKNADRAFVKARTKAWKDTEDMNPADRRDAILNNKKLNKAEDRARKAGRKLGNNFTLNKLRNNRKAQNESLSQSILRDAHSVLTMNESEAGEMTTWQFTARGFSKAMINKQPVFGSDNIRCIIHENANGKVVGTAVVDYYMSEAQVEEAIKKALAENGFRASNITNLVNLF